jgi:hypothetical protein
MTAAVIAIAPIIAHIGAVGSDRWRPEARGLLKGKLGEFAGRRVLAVLLLNGFLLAGAYLAWRLLPGAYFWIPLLLALPTVALQVALAAESSRQSTIRRR